MLMGVAIGSLVTLLFRRGPGGRRPGAIALRTASAGARVAGRYGARGARWAGTQAAEGADWVRERGADLRERLPDVGDVLDEVGDYLHTAREAINDTVAEELKDLRKAIRRQRKRIGL
jgi:gas vesicle protein